MGLTPDPWGWWWLAWVALVPLWWSVRAGNWRQSAIAAAVWGFGYHGLALFWITGVHPMTWLGVNWWASLAIAIAVWLAIVAWGMVLCVLWAVGMASLTSKLPAWQRVVVGCALFCLLETLWSWGPLYWTALGYTQSPHALLLLQISRLSGQQTLTAAIAATNGLLAEAWGRPKLRPSYLLAAIVLPLAIAGYGAYITVPARVDAGNGRALRAGIIQGNLPNPVKLQPRGLELGVQRYADGYTALARLGVDFILTPETALPFMYPDPDPRRDPFDRAVRAYGVPVWVGGFGRSQKPATDPTYAPYAYTNSLFLNDGRDRLLAQYDKVRLVPVGEYIPFRAVLGGIIRRLSPLRGEVEAGSMTQLVDTPWGRAILGICYESAYPAHFRRQAAAGGSLILTASNNAHYAATMPAQHHAQDVARAVETDRWAVRATNTGYSAIVEPTGRTRWISGINTYEIHADTVYLRHTQTPYVRWGDWLTPLLVAIAGGMLIACEG